MNLLIVLELLLVNLQKKWLVLQNRQIKLPKD